MMKTAEVSINEGRLRGREVNSSSGNFTYFSFLGIPYGKPPCGQLRFKDPLPVDPWTGIRDALEVGNIPIQLNIDSNEIEGDEDCLYLNVHSPKLSFSSNDQLLPVIFWIHGGGFKYGNGNSDPEYLLQHNVVVVTCNYRLGILGFLSFEDEKIPGNFALKDQLLAMHWVKKNIVSFGGDPNNVTLYGQSSGAALVHLHILSPKSKGLFHRAIMQSGCALNPWSKNIDSRKIAFELGKMLGCITDDEDKLIDFFKCVQAYDIICFFKKYNTSPQKNINGSFDLGPVIESPGPKSFLTEDPHVLLREGRFNHVPIIFTLTDGEGYITKRFSKEIKYIKEIINGDPTKLTGFHIEKLLKKNSIEKEFREKVKRIYLNDKPITDDNIVQLYDVYGDYNFITDLLNSMDYHVQWEKRTTNKIYFLLFSYNGNLGFLKKILKLDHCPGVCHGDELNYIFRNWIEPPPGFEKQSNDDEIIYQITKRMTNFAKTSDPNSDMERLKVLWEPVTEDRFCYFDMNMNPKMCDGPLYPERMQFWNEIYELLGLK